MSRSMSLGGLRIASPVWAGDFLDREFLIPGGGKVDASSFNKYTVDVTVTLSAAANAGDLQLTVNALTGPLMAGATLNFGIPGLFAVIDAPAATNDTVVKVMALTRAIPAAASAQFVHEAGKIIPSGTLVGRTIAQRDAGTPFHAAIDADEQIALVAFDVTDADKVNDVELARPYAGLVVKENFLPNYAAIKADATLLAALRARYVCIIGQD